MLRDLSVVSVFATALCAQTNFPPPPGAVAPNSPRALLGMALFFEEQLSSTGTVACATCHDLAHGGADPRALTAFHPGADGVFGTADDRRGSPGVPGIAGNGAVQPHSAHGFAASVTPRRAPTVVNTGYHTALTYDGSKTTLEQVIPVPILNSVEMAHTGRTWNDVAQRLAAVRPLAFASDLPPRLQSFLANHTYPQLFQLAFGSSQISQANLSAAVAAYLRTLNSDESKWDRVLHNQDVLTAEEQYGLMLFTGSPLGATACAACHGDFESRVLQQGPVAGQFTTVSTPGYYTSTITTHLVFHNVGVQPVAEDPGRQNATGLAADAGKFRVASLRNVELTAPYFHTGAASTLMDVLDFYDRGGDYHQNQAQGLSFRYYSLAEKNALIALLRTLTDPRLAAGVFPFDRPTLGAGTLAMPLPMGVGAATAAGRTLELRAPFAARLGENWFQFTLAGASPGSPVFLLLDTALGNLGMAYGIELGFSPAFQVQALGLATASNTAAAGIARGPLPLPNQPALSGMLLYGQMLVVDVASPQPFLASNSMYVPLR